MMKNQKFKKTSGDFVPQIYLSGMDKDKLKKEFGRLLRGLLIVSSMFQLLILLIILMVFLKL